MLPNKYPNIPPVPKPVQKPGPEFACPCCPVKALPKPEVALCGPRNKNDYVSSFKQNIAYKTKHNMMLQLFYLSYRTY